MKQFSSRDIRQIGNIIMVIGLGILGLAYIFSAPAWLLATLSGILALAMLFYLFLAFKAPDHRKLLIFRGVIRLAMAIILAFIFITLPV